MKSANRSLFLSRTLRALLAAMLWAAGLHVATARDEAGLPGEILVQLRSTQALAALLYKYELGVMGQFGARPIYRLKVMGKSSAKRTMSDLLLETDVLFAEPNTVNGSPEARKNAVWMIGTRQAYAAQWAPAALRLPEAHRLTAGAGVRVAVLDTGVDRTHPALAGRLLPGFDFVDYDNDPSEEGSEADAAFGHGTHVAGLVALVAPDAMIMPVRVLDILGQSNAWVLAEALLYAVDPDGDPHTDDGAHVINLSLGTTSRTRIFDAVARIATCAAPFEDDLADSGYDSDAERCYGMRSAIIVAAAGNDGSEAVREYPAAETSVGTLVAVGASAANMRRANFSNFGSWITLAAPGEGITSTVPGGGYGTWSGTSMAAPLAAGTAALLSGSGEGLKPREIIRRIVSRTTALCDTNMRQIDAYAALTDVQPAKTNCR